MLIGLIATLVMYLIIIVYISTHTNDTVNKLKMSEIQVKTIYTQEKILLNSTEIYIEDKKTLPTNVQKLIDDNYLDNSFNVGSYDLSLLNNNTTLKICHNWENNNNIYQKFYLNHYLGKELGYKPYIDTSGNFDVCHDFPLRIKTIDALNN